MSQTHWTVIVKTPDGKRLEDDVWADSRADAIAEGRKLAANVECYPEGTTLVAIGEGDDD